MIPDRLIKLFLPPEVKDMLSKLKGSRTLLLLVIGNLPSVFQAAANLLNGTGHEDIATSALKIGTGLLSVLTVLSRFIPADKPQA